MRGMICKDLCLFRRSLDIRVLLIGAVAMAILVAKQGVYAGMLTSITLDMTVGALSVLVFEKEEKAEWGKYQRILPVGCGTVVAGKYTAVLLTVLFSLAGSVALNLAVFAVYRTFLPEVLALSALLAVTIPLLWAAICLPLCYWFGFQVSQYASMALIFPLFFVVKNFEDGMWAVSDLTFLLENPAFCLLIGLLILAGLLLLSLALSAMGYCRRK